MNGEHAAHGIPLVARESVEKIFGTPNAEASSRSGPQPVCDPIIRDHIVIT